MANIESYDNSFEAEAITWKSWLNEKKPGKIDFIKMDIEGGEVEVIPHILDYLKREKPDLHLSLHGAYVKNKNQLPEILGMLSFYPYCYDKDMNLFAFTNDFLIGLEETFYSCFFTTEK